MFVPLYTKSKLNVVKGLKVGWFCRNFEGSSNRGRGLEDGFREMWCRLVLGARDEWQVIARPGKGGFLIL